MPLREAECGPYLDEVRLIFLVSRCDKTVHISSKPHLHNDPSAYAKDFGHGVTHFLVVIVRNIPLGKPRLSLAVLRGY